jgi:mannose-6-phosphate isomerase-like protein (cupin superfamily)
MDENLVPGAFQMNCSWYLKKLEKGPRAHTHDEDEIIGFFGNDPDDPHNLHGEVEMWVGDKQFILNKSTLIFVPGGMTHCPLNLLRVDKPIFHFTVVSGGQYIMKDSKRNAVPESGYSRYVVTELKEPEARKKLAPVYNTYARRILWMDNDVVPGAFNLNASWYLKASTTIDDKPHTHDHDEIIGFCGNDSDNPHDLNGEIEIWLEGEKQIITKSAMIFVPAGMVHCPLTLKRVDRPIFHFTVVMSGSYVKNEKV